MGMSQPPNSTMRPPWLRCQSKRGVRKGMNHLSCETTRQPGGVASLESQGKAIKTDSIRSCSYGMIAAVRVQALPPAGVDCTPVAESGFLIQVVVDGVYVLVKSFKPAGEPREPAGLLTPQA